MRVVLIGPFPPPHGGVQTHVAALQRRLQARGHVCHVINITRHRQADTESVFYPTSAVGLMRRLFTGRYDLIHLHLGGMLPKRNLALALVCATVPGAHSAFTFHSGGFPESEEGRRASRASFAGFVLRRFDSVIGVNDALLDVFARWGVTEDRRHLILPFPDVDPSDDAAVAPRPDMDAFIADHDRILLTVGLLEPEYDLALQVTVMEAILQTSPQCGLMIIGSGSLEQEIRSSIEACGYGDHILLCGDVPHPRTIKAIADCDVLLRTTWYDGDAISIREALQLGTPVVATDNGMRPPGPTLFPPRDGDALVAAVRPLLNAPKKKNVRPAEKNGTADHIDTLVELHESTAKLAS